MPADPTKLTKGHERGFSGIALCIARVPETSRLLIGGSDAKIHLWDAADEKAEPAVFGEAHTSYVTGVAMIGSEQLVSCSYDCRLIWWDVAKQQAVRTIDDAHERWIRRVAVSPDGKLVATVADDMHCKLWNAASGELVRVLDDHAPTTPNNYPSMLYALAFSPDGRLLATGDKTGHVAVWDVSSGEKLGSVECPVMYTWDPKARRHSIGGVRSVAFSHDGKTLAAGGIGTIGNIDHLGGPSRIEVFDWQSQKRLHEISDDKIKGLVEQIQFHPGDDWFLACGGDHGGFVGTYETKTGKTIKKEKAPSHTHAFATNADDTQLHVACHGKLVEFRLDG